MIATLNNTATPNTTTTTLAATLESLFVELDLHLAGTATGQTDLVIDELDLWTNSGPLTPACFSEITWSFVPEMTER